MSAGERLYLGIDCGTQATKALLVNAKGRPLGRGYAPHALTEGAGGRREQDPAWWVEAAVVSVQQALTQAGTRAIAGVGVSGQQHGLIVLDANRKVIRPAKLWNDTETAPQNSRLLAAFGGAAAWLARFGIAPLTGYTVSKLLWLREAEPESFARIRHILLPHDYLNFYLTGRLAAEWGDASGTGFFDPRTRCWLPEVLDWIDEGTGQLTAALPPLLRPGESVGLVLPEVASQLGLTGPCLVSAGGGDNMMGALGTGNVRPGVVTVSLGTSSTVYSFQAHSLETRDPAIAPFCSSSGGWLALVCTMNCTNVVGGTLALLGRGVEEIDRALDATAAGAGGLTFLPFLNGERTPDLPGASGALLGLTATNYTPAHLLRATLEGVTFGIVAGLERITGGRIPERIIAVGGGARSLAWRQLLADVTGSRVEVPEEDEAACLGAALQAMHSLECQAAGARSMEEITDHCVRMDAGRAAMPEPSRAMEVQAAFSLYRERLALLHSVGE